MNNNGPVTEEGCWPFCGGEVKVEIAVIAMC